MGKTNGALVGVSVYNRTRRFIALFDDDAALSAIDRPPESGIWIYVVTGRDRGASGKQAVEVGLLVFGFLRFRRISRPFPPATSLS